jgi:hypothetical protein
MNIQTAIKIVHEAHRNFVSADASLDQAIQDTLATLNVYRVRVWPTDTEPLIQLRDAHLLVIRTAHTNPALLTAWVKQLTPVSA